MNKLKEYRIKLHMTQEQLAQELGVQRTTVTLWENGTNKPRTDMLPRIARVLKCTVDSLLCQ